MILRRADRLVPGLQIVLESTRHTVKALSPAIVKDLFILEVEDGEGEKSLCVYGDDMIPIVA